MKRGGKRRKEPEKYDLSLKLLTLGETAVGKTSIIFRYVDNRFFENCKTTIGIDYQKKIINYNNFTVLVKVWDTAGQEKFQSITKQYYNNAQGVFIIFDVSSRASFEQIEPLVARVNEDKRKDCILILVGNKIDLPRDVEKSEALELSNKLNIPYFEVSACTGEGIQKMFDFAVDSIIKTSELTDSEGNPKRNTLNLVKTSKKSSCC